MPSIAAPDAPPLQVTLSPPETQKEIDRSVENHPSSRRTPGSILTLAVGETNRITMDPGFRRDDEQKRDPRPWYATAYRKLLEA
jgi:hypothetical protein